MPTPFGVNYLPSFLQSSLIPQLSKDKNPKVDVHLICMYLITYMYVFNYKLFQPICISI